jgi:hypothetical protein
VPFGGFAELQEEHSTTSLRAQRQNNVIFNLIGACGRRVKEIAFAGSKNDQEQVQKYADICVTRTHIASQDCGRNNKEHDAHDEQISKVIIISYLGG